LLLELFFSTFASMNEMVWTENVILVDADHVDKVAFDLIVNFERMLERRIPQADMAKWVECVALDGGLREGEHQTTVILVHDKDVAEMKNFVPGRFAEELEGKAFKGNMGEFCFSTPNGEGFVLKDELFLDTLQTMLQQKEVRRVMVVGNDDIYNKVRNIMLRMNADDDKRVTVFSMQPLPGGNFRTEILGYSLMAALGIRGEELER
jgi:hypothetical protein